jgi:hypothetical protein
MPHDVSPGRLLLDGLALSYVDAVQNVACPSASLTHVARSGSDVTRSNAWMDVFRTRLEKALGVGDGDEESLDHIQLEQERAQCCCQLFTSQLLHVHGNIFHVTAPAAAATAEAPSSPLSKTTAPRTSKPAAHAATTAATTTAAASHFKVEEKALHRHTLGVGDDQCGAVQLALSEPLPNVLAHATNVLVQLRVPAHADRDTVLFTPLEQRRWVDFPDVKNEVHRHLQEASYGRSILARDGEAHAVLGDS